MKKSKPCPICGPLGTQKDGYTLGHTATCTPALRALVRAAAAWGNSQWGDVTHDEALNRAVARWEKAKTLTRAGQIRAGVRG